MRRASALPEIVSGVNSLLKMEQSNPFAPLSLGEIALRCAQETQKFFQNVAYEAGYCFELFRRAVVGSDQRAWDLVYQQYHAQVLRWVNRHPAFSACREEAQYFVNRVFERLWRSLTPDKFANFADLKRVLAYLQLCVHSLILDDCVRAREAPDADDQELDELLERLPYRDGQTPEDEALTRNRRRQLWRWLAGRLKDEQERAVIEGLFVFGLKPRQMLATYPGLFASVQDVYRLKQNVLDRLRRDSGLGEFLDGA